MGYQRTGLRGSKELAERFATANALGAMLGARNNLTIVDVDTRDKQALDAALSIYGDTPIISRTASGGGFHAWYQYSEAGWQHHGTSRRAVRPDKTKPFDFLGAGMAVLPPSIGPLGQYEFIRGGPDDIDALRPLAQPVPAGRLDAAAPICLPALPAVAGNNTTWRFAMRAAKGAQSFEQLLQQVLAFNEQSQPPLEKEEIMTICQSARDYTETNRNWFGQHGAYFPTEEVVSMVQDQDAFFLLAFLRAHQGPWATFMVANGIGERLDWDRRRVAAARRRLIEMGYLIPLRQAGKGHPALFKWGE
jgi:hypothetical protein